MPSKSDTQPVRETQVRCTTALLDAVREALEQIAKAYDEWRPDGNFASTVLARCSRIAREALSLVPQPVKADAVRESIARVIDSAKWEQIDHWRTYYDQPGHTRLQRTTVVEAAPSLTKADEILAVLSLSISPVDERLFDLLEGLRTRLDANGYNNGAVELSSCFARRTGGAEIVRIIDTIAPVRNGRREVNLATPPTAEKAK